MRENNRVAFVVGAQKAGTTSLHFDLVRNKIAYSAVRKEVHFFDYNFSKGKSHFLRKFPSHTDFFSKEAVFLDSSPSYLFHPAVPYRIAELLPNAKIIVLLREPKVRALSHYFHNRRKGREEREILDAFFHGEAEIESLVAQHGIRAYDDPEGSVRHYSYLRRGLYSEQLKRFYNCFPKENINVIYSEDYFANPSQAVASVADFLEVSVSRPILTQQLNAGENSRQQLDNPSIEAFFERDLLELREILGTIPWPLEPK